MRDCRVANADASPSLAPCSAVSEILLLDEPTSGLDAGSERRIADSLRSLTRHRTLLSVTHSPVIAALADRVFEVRDNTLVPVPTSGSRLHVVKDDR